MWFQSMICSYTGSKRVKLFCIFQENDHCIINVSGQNHHQNCCYETIQMLFAELQFSEQAFAVIWNILFHNYMMISKPNNKHSKHVKHLNGHFLGMEQERISWSPGLPAPFVLFWFEKVKSQVEKLYFLFVWCLLLSISIRCFAWLNMAFHW